MADTGEIYGATCSFSGRWRIKNDGAPLQKELFRAYMESMDESREIQTRYDEKNPFYKNVKMDLFTFFDGYFGIDLGCSKPMLFPSFEEALGILEVEGSYAGSGKVRKYKDAIVASMALAIESQLEHKRNEDNYQIIDSYHKQLVENLCDRSGRQVDFCRPITISLRITHCFHKGESSIMAFHAKDTGLGCSSCMVP